MKSVVHLLFMFVFLVVFFNFVICYLCFFLCFFWFLFKDFCLFGHFFCFLYVFVCFANKAKQKLSNSMLFDRKKQTQLEKKTTFLTEKKSNSKQILFLDIETKNFIKTKKTTKTTIKFSCDTKNIYEQFYFCLFFFCS